MEGNLVLGGQTRQGGDVINNTVREIRCRPNKENSVRIDQTTQGMDVNLELRRWAGNSVQLDLEVVASLDERSVGGIGDDPEIISIWSSA